MSRDRSLGTELRVAVDATPLLDHLTGIGVFTRELLERLAGDPTIDTVPFAVSWRGRDRLRLLLPDGVTPVRRPMAARPLRHSWRLLGFPPIEWWSGSVDVVHGTNFVVPPTRRAASLVTVHDLTPVRFPELCTADTRAYPTLIEAAVERGAHVHTDSEYVAGEVRDHFGLTDERVHAVHLGVADLPDTTPGEGAVLAGAERYLLALGTVEPRKDLPLLVEAFAPLVADDPDLHLVIAGPDGWGAGQLDEAIAGSPGARNIVRIRRYVTDLERAALLRDATAFVYPSRYEGFGLPPLEAMAAGTPVVATRAGSLPEVLDDAAVLVPTGDAPALADAIWTVLTDEMRCRQLTSRGSARSREFSWDRTARELTDLYHLLSS